MQFSPKFIRSLRRCFVAIVAIAITGAAHANFDTRSLAQQGKLLVPTPAHAKLWSLGFDAAVADYYWLRALEFVGGAEGRVESHGELIADLIDVITTIDPWVGHPYRFAAVWLTRDWEMVERGNELLKRGIRHNPLQWRNHYHLGFNYFFYLGDNLAAADALEAAAALEGGPSYLGPLAARLRSSGGGLSVAKALLEELVASTSDPYSEARYLKTLDEIGIEERARFLDSAREEYSKRQGRDIEDVSDLLIGPAPVLRELPSAHLHLDGFNWFLDSETGQITSSYYKSRYKLHVPLSDKARQERWQKQRKLEMGASG